MLRLRQPLRDDFLEVVGEIAAEDASSRLAMLLSDARFLILE